MRENRLGELCHSNEKAIGTFLTMNAPLIAESLARAGYDFFFLDMQHGGIGADAALNILTAISTTSVTPIVRVPGNSPALIMQALDFGAYGVVCPLINTRQEAEQFVAAMRYPPTGHRSYGPLRGALYGGEDYALHANTTLMAIAMIETRQGFDNLEDILETPGLDAVLVGPNDLSFSMTGQVSGNSPDPGVQEAITAIARTANAKGIFPGIHCTDAEMARDMFDRGYRFCSISSDQGIMTRAAVDSVQSARPRQ